MSLFARYLAAALFSLALILGCGGSTSCPSENATGGNDTSAIDTAAEEYNDDAYLDVRGAQEYPIRTKKVLFENFQYASNSSLFFSLLSQKAAKRERATNSIAIHQRINGIKTSSLRTSFFLPYFSSACLRMSSKKPHPANLPSSLEFSGHSARYRDNFSRRDHRAL